MRVLPHFRLQVLHPKNTAMPTLKQLMTFWGTPWRFQQRILYCTEDRWDQDLLVTLPLRVGKHQKTPTLKRQNPSEDWSFMLLLCQSFESFWKQGVLFQGTSSPTLICCLWWHPPLFWYTVQMTRLFLSITLSGYTKHWATSFERSQFILKECLTTMSIHKSDRSFATD